MTTIDTSAEAVERLADALEPNDWAGTCRNCAEYGAPEEHKTAAAIRAAAKEASDD